MCFEDESGFCLVSPLKRTWAPRGHTPVVRTSISHHQRINLLGALLISPAGRHIHLCTHRHTCSITGDQVVAFLQQLLRRVRGPIVLVWDNHPIHRRRLVRDFIARHPRLHVYVFPSYAPELNPTEGLWTQTDEGLAGTAPHHLGELHANLDRVLRRLYRSARRRWACIFMSDLPWPRPRQR